MTDLRKAAAQPEQGPVAFVTGYFGGHLTITCFDPALVLPDGLALYTAPPKRKWVGLTYKDITRLQDEYTTEWGAYTVDFIKAIEAKLKEKNT